MDKWLKRINCPSRVTSTAITRQPTVEGALSSDNNPRYSSPSRSTFNQYASSDAPVASQAASIAKDNDEASDAEPPDAGKHAARNRETTLSKRRKYDDSYIALGFTCISTGGFTWPQCVICAKVLSQNSRNPALLRRHLETKHAHLRNKPHKFFGQELRRLSTSNSPFTPKATWATSCHSFSMYAGDEERPTACATQREQRKLTDAQLYANEQWCTRSQLGTDVIDGLLYRPMPAAWKTRPFGHFCHFSCCSYCHTGDNSDVMWATTGDFMRTQSKTCIQETDTVNRCGLQASYVVSYCVAKTGGHTLLWRTSLSLLPRTWLGQCWWGMAKKTIQTMMSSNDTVSQGISDMAKRTF